MPKFEAIPQTEVKAGVSPELLDELKRNVRELKGGQAGKLTLEKGESPKEIRKALRAVAVSLSQRVRFPRTAEKGTVVFYLLDCQAKGQTAGFKVRVGREDGQRRRPDRIRTIHFH